VKLPESWVSTWEPPEHQTLGFLIGALFALGAAVSLHVVAALSADAMTPGWTFTQRFFAWLAVALLVVGCVSGLAAYLYRPLRRLGVGIFSGLIIVFPLSILLGVVLLWEGS
jgi:hypothetical protein